MTRLIDFARGTTALPVVAFALTVFLLAASAAGQTNYCNNAVPPCDPDNPVTLCFLPPTPPPLCEPLQCGKCTKSPCYVASGGYVYEAVDLVLRTTGLPIAIERMYHSTQTIDGPSGYGWSSTLDARLYYTVFLKAAPDTYEREAHVQMPDGARYRFVENGDGSFRPPAGRLDALVRNADETWTLRLQRTRSDFHFSPTGNLLSMADDYGNTVRWTYAGDRLQRIEDVSGSARYVDVTYGADGRISDVTDFTGRNVRYTYDSRGVMTSVTNPANQTTSYSYTAGKYVPLLTGVADHWARTITMVVYDSQDRVRSYTDEGETYTYTYGYGGAATTTAKTDSAGNRWLYLFDKNGLVTESRAPDGTTPPRSTYDANGFPLLETDAVGVKTAYTYDAAGNWLTTTLDAGGASAVEWRVVYHPVFTHQAVSMKAYDPATNQIHPDWQGSQITYHPDGSPAPGAIDKIYALDNDGTTARVTAAFTYDEHGRILTVTNASGAVTKSTYDASGNVTAVERPSNNSAGTRPVTTFTYDPLGRNTSVTDPEGNVTTYTWDALDRVVSVTFPRPSASSTVTFAMAYVYDEYDGTKGLLFTRVTDASGHSVRYGYDAFGRQVERFDQANNVRRNVFARGLPESRIDANGYQTSYTWDAKRRLSSVTFPDGTSDRYTYRSDDLVATKTDRSNRTTTYTYDGLKRGVREAYPDGSAIAYAHRGQNLVQIVDTVASPSETHDLTWDASFRLTADSQATRGTITYAYTPEGWVGTTAVTGGTSTSYSYYPDGSVRTIGWSPLPAPFEFEYTAAGRPRSIIFPNGQSRSYAYDALGRLTQISNTHPAAGVLASFGYAYDIDPASGQPTPLGLRTTITANVPSIGVVDAVTKLGYDLRGQLTRAEYPSQSPYNGDVSSWTYDGAGHRTSSTTNGVTSTYSYAKFGTNTLNSPRLLSDGGSTYTYDGEGNVTARAGSRGDYTFSWDLNNLLEAVGGDVAATYTHDDAWRRTAKTVNGTTATYLYDGEHAVVESGPTRAEFVYAPGIDEPLAMLRDGTVYYYSVDGLNSVVALTDAGGSVQSSYAWDVWGSPLVRDENVSNPFGYTGREFAEGGLHYYRLRSYEAASGRFASEDPLQDAVPVDGADLYSYAASSPVMYRDPFGLEPQIQPCVTVPPSEPPGCPPLETWGELAKTPGAIPQRCLDLIKKQAADGADRARRADPLGNPDPCKTRIGCWTTPGPPEDPYQKALREWLRGGPPPGPRWWYTTKDVAEDWASGPGDKGQRTPPLYLPPNEHPEGRKLPKNPPKLPPRGAVRR